MRHLGSYDDLETTDQALIEWVLGSSQEPADFPIIHHFLDDPDAAPTESLRADALLLLQTKDQASC
jgi:DNA gyrase inhibitor GyrI